MMLPCLALLAAGVAVAADKPVLYVERTTGAIVVDGRFDEPQWKTADAVRDFGQCTFMNRRATILPDTWMRVLWDDRYLYVAMRCGEDHPDVNVPRLKTHAMNSSLPPDHRESVELQFDGNSDGHTKVKCHIVLSGEKVATRHGPGGSDGGFGAGADWDYRAVADGGGWQFEARFSLADFGIPAREGCAFGLEPCRLRVWKHMTALDGTERLDQTRFVSWGTKGVHHNTTSRFGRAVLCSRRPDGVMPQPVFADVARTRELLDETRRLLARVDGFDDIRTNVAGLVARTAAEPISLDLGRYVADRTHEWNRKLEDEHWAAVLRTLRKEGVVREPVTLVADASLPAFDADERLNPHPSARGYPHLDWAKRPARKPGRTLVCVNQYGAIDAYRLLQRLGLDADVFWQKPGRPADSDDFYWWPEGHFSGVYRQRILEHMLATRQYENFVFLGLGPDSWRDRLQCWLYGRLLDGARAVIVGMPCYETWGLERQLKQVPDFARGLPPDMPIVTNGAPARVCASVYNAPPLRSAAIGKGRVTAYLDRYGAFGLAYQLLEPLSPCRWMLPSRAFADEYLTGQSVRAVMEGLDMRGDRKAVTVSTGTPTVSDGADFDVELETRGAVPFAGRVRYVVRDTWGKVVQPERTQDVRLERGVRHVSLSVGKLPAGDYYLTAHLLASDGGVLDFAVGAVHVRPSDRFPCPCGAAACRRRLPAAVVASVRPTKDWFRARDAISADVTVANVTAGLVLETRLRDPRHRVIEQCRYEVPVTNGLVRVALPSDRLDFSCNILETRLFAGDRLLDVGEERVIFRRTGRHADYEVYTDLASYGGAMSEIRDAFMDFYGVTMSSSGGAAWAMRGGTVAREHHVNGWTPLGGGSMSSPGYAKRLARLFRRDAEALRALDGHFLSLGDDSGYPRAFAAASPDWWPLMVERDARRAKSSPSAFCASSLTARDFSDFVAAAREAYPTVERFNRHNGTALADWKDLKPETLKGLKPHPMPEFLNFCYWLKERYQGDIAKLNVRWKGAFGDFFDITDAWIESEKAKENLAPAVDRAVFFEKIYLDQFKAIADAVRAVDETIGVGFCASWFGNAMPEIFGHLNVSGNYLGNEDVELIRAFPHVYQGETIGVYDGLTVPEAMRDRQVFHGLFSGANFSWFWCTFNGLGGDMSCNRNRARKMLECYREATRGLAALTRRARRENDGIRILASRAAGRFPPRAKGCPTHVDARRAMAGLVEDLGLSFDYVTTPMVEAGELLKNGTRVLLLGGVQTLTDGEIRQIRKFVKGGGHVLCDVVPATCDNWGVVLDRSRLADDEFELLGFDPSVYACRRDFGRHLQLRTSVLARLAAWGIRPPFVTVDGKGEPVSGVRYSRFVRGDAICLGYEKTPAANETFPLQSTLQLPSRKHVYDIRGGRYLGCVTNLALTLTGLDDRFFALLPYRVEVLNLVAPAEIAVGKSLHVEATLQTSQTLQSSQALPAHVFRFELIPPEGLREEVAAPVKFKLVDAPKGRVASDFAIAWNERHDWFDLVVTDVMTGVSARRRVRVLQRSPEDGRQKGKDAK